MTIAAAIRGMESCLCGKAHVCDIRYVEIGDGVLGKLDEICADFRSITLVADGNTYPLCGDKVKCVLGEKIVSEVLFGKELIVPNENAIEKIECGMTPTTDLLLGIGSGVINDLCKHVSFRHGMRYVIVATAPSMDGYASVGAAMILEEMKVTTNAAAPYAIVAETDVLCTAPADMLRSGYGDIVGKYSCLCDWRLSYLMRGEYFCQFVHDTVMETVKRAENTAKSILAREKDAIKNLMEGLVMVGIMMSYVGNSRPASGSEHHLSHFFEITGLLRNKDYYLHGIDVLYSAAVTAQLRERLCALKKPLPAITARLDGWRDDVKEIYSSAADGVIALQERVGLYGEIDREATEAKWNEIVTLLSKVPDYETMCGYVSAIGLDMEDFKAFYGEETIREATLYAKDLKDRYTVLWLSYALGIEGLD